MRHRPAHAAPVVEHHAHVDRGGLRLARARHDLLHDRPDLRDRHVRERAGRELAARDLGGHRVVHRHAGEPRRQHPVADPPPVQALDLDRERVGRLGGAVGDAHLQPLAQERADRVREEPRQVLELEHGGRRAGQRRVQERARLRAVRRQRAGARQRHVVEAPRLAVDEPAGLVVARIERLQRVLDQHVVADAPAVDARGAVRHVQQLPDRHRGRARDVRALVVAGVGDDQPVGRRHQRVEQHLAVLGARVPVADVRVGEQQVVAVARGLARERGVVQAEQAHDPVRHRAHRHERADRQVAGAEVRARRPALQALGQQRADLGRLERAGVARRLAHDVVQQPLQLAALPAVAPAGGRQRVGGRRDRLRPLRHGLRARSARRWRRRGAPRAR